MAASMRVVNVKNKCASISLRFFLSRNRNIILSSFSHHSPIDRPSQHEKEEEEDFFGIPENFSLQQVRLDTTGQENKEHLINGSVPSRADLSSLSAESGRSTRHKVVERSFTTTFGAISFDRTVMNTSPNLSTEDLAEKAQEILTKLNIDWNTSTSSSNKKDNIGTQRSSFSKEFLKQKNDEVQKQANPDSVKAANHRASANYFDEVYFPEQSLGKDTRTSEQTFSRRSSRHSTRSATPGHSETNISASDSSLSEVKNILKSKTPRQALHHEVHDEHHKSITPHSLNVIDEQYFGAVLTDRNEKIEHTQPPSSTEDPLLMSDHFNKLSVGVSQRNSREVKNKDKLMKEAVDLNEIDRQYFGRTSQNLNVQQSNLQQETMTVDERTNPSFQNMVKDYINPSNLKQKITESSQINKDDHVTQASKEVDQNKFAAERKLEFETSNKQGVKDTFPHLERNMNNAESSYAAVKDIEKHTTTNSQKSKETFHRRELTTDTDVITNEEFLKKRKIKKAKTEVEGDKPKTAYDVAMKIRQQLQQGTDVKDIPKDEPESSSQTTEEKIVVDSNIKLDSKGFRVLDNQVPDLDKMTSADIVRMLKSRIIFDHDDFLAIDKPYGLPCYSQAKDRVSVTELLPAFTERLSRSYNTNELHLVQGLDRDVTGAIILAKNPEVAHVLRGMYKDSDLVTQKYWAITKGVPKPLEGIIDIPIGEAKVGNIYKMVLRPRFLKDEKFIGRTSKASSERAITEYKVLTYHLQSALVECLLLTNVKHQIRLHLASGLGTPILGDHKYSNFAKLAPQKLHKEMLELLKIRQASVRHLVMHLHCRSVILKDYKGRMIFLTTHPPSHFSDNMRNLRIPKVTK